MFKNYILIALRNLKKNKLYALINVFGLAIGLMVFLFGTLVIDYEKDHDTMWANQDRVYAIGAKFHPKAPISFQGFDGAHTAMGPLLKENLVDVEYVARTIRRGFVISNGEDNFSENIRFMDKDFTRIFDLKYIDGNQMALDDPTGIILTRSAAEKIFGTVSGLIGQTLEVDHKTSLVIKAVVEDMPRNSHFVSTFIDTNGFSFYASLEALNSISGYNLDGNWNNLSTGNRTYIMTRKPISVDLLTQQVNAIFEKYADQEMRENFMTALTVIPLTDLNAYVWTIVGIPAFTAVQLLSLFILGLAIINYTNLATAQGMGRLREVGMRKTLGATRLQLITQFLVESTSIVFIAILFSMVIIELIIAGFNGFTGRVLTIDYMGVLPTLIMTTLVVGILAGLYPAYLITRVQALDTLKQSKFQGRSGSLFRSVMIGMQFVVTITIFSIIMTMIAQNNKIEADSDIFPKDEVITMSGLNKQDIMAKEEVLRQELMAIPAIKSVTFANQVPFEQSNHNRSVSRVKGDSAAQFSVNFLITDPAFIPTFDIPLMAGRNLSFDVTADFNTRDDNIDTNVVINELLAKKLGFASAAEAIGQSFYGPSGENSEAFDYRIVGVVETQNILGFHNSLRPWVFIWEESTHFYGAIRLEKSASSSVITDIETVWKKVLPKYPMEHQFLGDIFQGMFQIFEAINMVVGAFVIVALLLALTGLFGLAAFMARGKTKEIGIRKILGATLVQVVRLLMVQFSKPVFMALVLALPLSYFGAQAYLQLFENKIDLLFVQLPIISGAGFIIVAFAWAVISVHALRVAQQNPIKALRYE